jgi:hypothetical protein
MVLGTNTTRQLNLLGNGGWMQVVTGIDFSVNINEFKSASANINSRNYKNF